MNREVGNQKGRDSWQWVKQARLCPDLGPTPGHGEPLAAPGSQKLCLHYPSEGEQQKNKNKQQRQKRSSHLMCYSNSSCCFYHKHLIITVALASCVPFVLTAIRIS